MAPVIGRKSQFFPIPHVFDAPVGDDRIRFSLGGARYVMACSVHGVPYTSKCAIMFRRFVMAAHSNGQAIMFLPCGFYLLLSFFLV